MRFIRTHCVCQCNGDMDSTALNARSDCYWSDIDVAPCTCRPSNIQGDSLCLGEAETKPADVTDSDKNHLAQASAKEADQSAIGTAKAAMNEPASFQLSQLLSCDCSHRRNPFGQ